MSIVSVFAGAMRQEHVVQDLLHRDDTKQRITLTTTPTEIRTGAWNSMSSNIKKQ